MPPRAGSRPSLRVRAKNASFVRADIQIGADPDLSLQYGRQLRRALPTFALLQYRFCKEFAHPAIVADAMSKSHPWRTEFVFVFVFVFGMVKGRRIQLHTSNPLKNNAFCG
jgi:hypothetical protein